MNEYIYQIINKYFNTLSLVGSFRYKDLEKLMVVIILDELINDNFRYCLSEDDIKLMERVLQKYYGTACSVPFVSCLKCN